MLAASLLEILAAPSAVGPVEGRGWYHRAPRVMKASCPKRVEALLTAALWMSQKLWQGAREICGGGTRFRVALRRTSAGRANGWRGSSPLTQFDTFFIHFHRESCCLEPWQLEVTDAHKTKATTLPATLPLTQKPRHFVRLSFLPTPTHRIFCKAIPPHFYHPTFHIPSTAVLLSTAIRRSWAESCLLKGAVTATFIKS